MSDAETKESLEIKSINVPGGVVVSGMPFFSSDSFIRYTKEGGESFPYITIKKDKEEKLLWFGGTGDGWVAAKRGKKKREPWTFMGERKKEIRGTFQIPLPEPEK